MLDTVRSQLELESHGLMALYRCTQRELEREAVSCSEEAVK